MADILQYLKELDSIAESLEHDNLAKESKVVTDIMTKIAYNLPAENFAVDNPNGLLGDPLLGGALSGISPLLGGASALGLGANTVRQSQSILDQSRAKLQQAANLISAYQAAAGDPNVKISQQDAVMFAQLLDDTNNLIKSPGSTLNDNESQKVLKVLNDLKTTFDGIAAAKGQVINTNELLRASRPEININQGMGGMGGQKLTTEEQEAVKQRMLGTAGGIGGIAGAAAHAVNNVMNEVVPGTVGQSMPGSPQFMEVVNFLNQKRQEGASYGITGMQQMQNFILNQANQAGKGPEFMEALKVNFDKMTGGKQVGVGF